MPDTWDITPTHPDYSGPRITLCSHGGDVWVARADNPDVRPWVLVPIDMLMYVDQQAVKVDYDRPVADAYNHALEGAFPDGPPGGCGGFIDLDTPDVDPWPLCAVHGGSELPCTCDTSDIARKRARKAVDRAVQSGKLTRLPGGSVIETDRLGCDQARIITAAMSSAQADHIRQTWYMMDGSADRPRSVADCWAVIESLLEVVGSVTGITNAAAVPPWEQGRAGTGTA
jgi:hypothetical protein